MRRVLTLHLLALTMVACEPEADLQPDEVLQAELGLSARDRVHRVTITGGPSERADPVALSIEPGAHVEFVTADWLIHEVVFDPDSVGPAQWSFLQRMNQTASPPLIDRGSRYVLTFADAPPGRYPYRIEGNGPAGGGLIIVADPQIR